MPSLVIYLSEDEMSKVSAAANKKGLKVTMETINKMGMVVRGLYGEGTRVMGNMLQISNQVTLGLSEQVIIDNLKRLVIQVSGREKKIRDKLIQKQQASIKDTVMRSHGVLLNAYKINSEESLDLISNVRFGVYTGILDMNISKLDNLMIKIQPAHIQQIENKKMSALDRDIARAKIIKDTLGG